METNRPLLGVFTPTYNREKCLYKCYQSLCNQTSYNFEWYIIDDGSTDGTRQAVEKWQRAETRFSITYMYKENGGLHTGYNKAMEIIENELNVCIDSDDAMPEDAVEKIEILWNKIRNKGYVGIMGIDCYEDGTVVGQAFPEDIEEMFLYEKLVKYHIPGDKKMIYRTDLFKKVAPMPVFPGEKDFNPSYMMYQLDRYGKLYVTNECYCIVDYQPDGMSSYIYKQYRYSPRSFAETRKLFLSFPEIPLGFKIKQSIHYVSSCILAKRFWVGMKESVYPVLTWFSVIPGMALTLVVLVKTYRPEFSKDACGHGILIKLIQKKI